MSQAAQAIFGQLLHLERQKPVTIYPNNDKYKFKKNRVCPRAKRYGWQRLFAGWLDHPWEWDPLPLEQQKATP